MNPVQYICNMIPPKLRVLEYGHPGQGMVLEQ